MNVEFKNKSDAYIIGRLPDIDQEQKWECVDENKEVSQSGKLTTSKFDAEQLNSFHHSAYL